MAFCTRKCKISLLCLQLFTSANTRPRRNINSDTYVHLLMLWNHVYLHKVCFRHTRKNVSIWRVVHVSYTMVYNLGFRTPIRSHKINLRDCKTNNRRGQKKSGKYFLRLSSNLFFSWKLMNNFASSRLGRKISHIKRGSGHDEESQVDLAAF